MHLYLSIPLARVRLIFARITPNNILATFATFLPTIRQAALIYPICRWGRTKL